MKLLILGSSGLVGSSLVRAFRNDPYFTEILTPTRQTLDLFNFKETKNYIHNEQPNFIVNAAAKVGGILANNTLRSDFILENLKINLNLLEALIPYKNIKLINLGSSCIYPLNAKNPIKEEYVMTGELEKTNSPYAMAKLTAIELGKSIKMQHGNTIINLMPTNLYGPNDNFSDRNSHVIPGLMGRMHKTKINNEKTFEVWGSGNPLREFLYVDDLASAILFIIKNNIEDELLNIGSQEEISIKELVNSLSEIINFNGEVVFNTEYPDGNPRKLLDSSKILSYGWKPKIKIYEGLHLTYNWYKNNII